MSQMEINFSFSPSAKQRQSPCSGPPPVYQDLSTRHDWPANQVEGKFKMYFQELVESVGGPEQGSRHCLADVTN